MNEFLKEDLETFYSNILDTITTAVLVYEKESKNVVYINKNFLEILGYSLEEVIGKDFYRFIHPIDIPFVKERIKKLEQHEDVPSHFFLRLITKEGEIIFGLFKSQDFSTKDKNYRLVIADNLGKVPFSFVNPLLASSFISFLSEYSNIGFWVDDLNNNTLYINRYFAEFLGVDEKEIRNRKITDFLTPESKLTYLKACEERKYGRKTSVYELVVLNKDKRPYHFKVFGGPIIDSVGNLIGSVGIFVSIEELWKLNLLLSKINSYVLRYSATPEEFWGQIGDDLCELFYAENVRIVVENQLLFKKGNINLLISDEELLEELVKTANNIILFDPNEISNIITNFKSAMVGLISVAQQPIGYIFLTSNIANVFEENDVKLFRNYCNQISLIYHYKDLYMQLQKEREYYSTLFSILSHDFVNAITSLDGYINYIIGVIHEQTDLPNTSEWNELERRTQNILERTLRIMVTVQQLTKIKTQIYTRKPISLKEAIQQAIETIRIIEKVNLDIKVDVPSHISVLAGDLLQNAFENIFYHSLHHSSNSVAVPKFSIKAKVVKNEVICEIIDYQQIIHQCFEEGYLTKIQRGDRKFTKAEGLYYYLAKKIIEAYNGIFKLEPLTKDKNEKGAKIIFILSRG